MKREGLIAAAVLVPFALLVLAGFWFTRPLPSAPVDPTATPPISIVLEPRGSPDTGRDAGLDAGAPVATPEPVRADLVDLVATAAPRVRRCLQDEEPRGRYEVRVRFTQTGAHADTQNPYLAACVEDVVEELGFRPDAGFTPAEHTFRFDGPP